MRRALLLLPTLAIAAGCGGGSGSSRLSHAEFVQQGNAICTDYYKKLKALPQVSSPDQLVGFIDMAQGYTNAAIDDLDKLQPPTGDEASFDAFLAQARDEVKLEDELRAAAKAKDNAELQAVGKRGDAMDKRANALAAKAGLDVCARPSSTTG